MADPNRPHSIADMPAQHAMAPATPAEARGRFFNTGNGFNVQLPPVPDRIFTTEPARALDPATPTGLIACIASEPLASLPRRHWRLPLLVALRTSECRDGRS
jgi:hypothetical protein